MPGECYGVYREHPGVGWSLASRPASHAADQPRKSSTQRKICKDDPPLAIEADGTDVTCGQNLYGQAAVPAGLVVAVP